MDFVNRVARTTNGMHRGDNMRKTEFVAVFAALAFTSAAVLAEGPRAGTGPAPTSNWTITSPQTSPMGTVNPDLTAATPTSTSLGGSGALSLQAGGHVVSAGGFTPAPEPATVFGICAAATMAGAAL